MEPTYQLWMRNPGEEWKAIGNPQKTIDHAFGKAESFFDKGIPITGSEWTPDAHSKVMRSDGTLAGNGTPRARTRMLALSKTMTQSIDALVAVEARKDEEAK